eukprot:jgi/Ulvmu1/9826/UM056_0067.1
MSVYPAANGMSDVSEPRRSYVRPDSGTDERRAVVREDENAARRRAHMRPENSVEERQFISLALAASIHDAKEQGRDGLVNFDPSCPPPGVSAGVPRISLPSPFSPPSFANNSHFAAGPSNMLRYNSSFSDPVVFSSHVEPLHALLEDCSHLKDLSREASSFREACTKLGAVGDEIKLAANNAAQKVATEDSSLYLSKLLASCHKEVSLAQTLISVYGNYSKVKKYAKLFRKWYIKDKLGDCEARLVTWLNHIWNFVKENSTIEFKSKYTELVQSDSVASGLPDHRSTAEIHQSHVSTPRERDDSAISGLAPLPSHYTDIPNLDNLLSSRASEPPKLSGRDGNDLEDPHVMDRMLTSVTSSRGGLGEPLRVSGRTKTATGRRTVRKIQVAHVMARTVTAVLYVDPVAPDPSSETSGCVWWWSGGHMNVHDIKSNNTTAKGLPMDKMRSKSVVKALALDCTRRWVWAGHDNGQVSIWREAKGKMSAVTGPEMSKSISAVYRLAPVIDLTVAVGCEGGRVLLLRIMEDAGSDGDRSATSSVAKLMQTNAPSHDDKLRIVQVGELRAMSNKSESAPGDDAPLSCAPPPMPTTGPMALKNVIRNLLHMRGPASTPMMIEGRTMARPTSAPEPCGRAASTCNGEDSYTGLLAEPGTPLAGKRLSGHFQTMPVQPIRTTGPGRSTDAPQTPPCLTPKSSVVAASGALSDASMSAAGGAGDVGPAADERGSVKKKASDDGLLRKVTKVGQDLKQLMRADKGALAMLGDDALVGRAHDNRIECIMAQHPYLFTASAANQACDAQIRMWVLSHEKGTLHYGLHDSYDCRANRATRSMCVLPWATDGAPLPSNEVGTMSGLSSMHGVKPWRLLTGHDSGNILMFDPALPHLKPLLTIKFPPFAGIAPVSISVLTSLQLIAVTRADGMVQLMSMITPDNRIMASAIDPTQPNEIMDGVVSLEKAGVLFRLHDRRIDHASVSVACDDLVTGTLRGNVSLWPRRLLHDKASEGGIIDKPVGGPLGADASRGVGGDQGDSNGEFGASLFRVKKQPFDQMRASTVLTDQDLDIVDSKDVKLNRHLGNGAFGTVREGVLHHTTVAVKILKEGEFRGALGSLVHAGEAEREDIRRGLVREVRILKGVRHPNVLFFRGICLNPPMIITELCEHGSVSDVITLTVRMSQPQSTLMLSPDKRAMLEEHMQWLGRVRLALDAAKGMLYLHSKDLLHCDLKSLNLLVDKAWTCKVADFGLSRYISGKQAGTNVPAVNNPMWQAPEVIANPGKCSKAGDVYSFGVILWEFLMMRRPWQGTPLMFIQHLVQGGKRPEVPADLSEVPTSRPGEVLWGVEEYVRLMRRCWDADPDVRPNFEHVVEELESIEKGASTRMSRSESRRQKWSETVRQQYGVQKEAASGMMRSSRLSSVNHSSASRRGSLPHVTSNTSSGNLSPLSTGWTPQQAMDLDAAVLPELPHPGSGSSPHTNATHKSSGEHSHRYDISVESEEAPPGTMEGEADALQYNTGIDVPPLATREERVADLRRRSSRLSMPTSEDKPGDVQEEPGLRAGGAATAPESNMLSFNNFLDEEDTGAVAREHDPESTMEGMEPAEILKGVERPRSPKSLREGSSDTQSTDSWGRMHGSSSDHPLAQVHITIGNSIQDKLHPEDMVSPVPSTIGGAVQPLDSIPENIRTADTFEEDQAAAAPDSDTLEMLLPGPYSIEGGTLDGRDLRRSNGRAGQRRPPRPPPPRRDAGQASDGMFHVSMDRSDIESLPVLDSSAGALLPASLQSTSGRHVFSTGGGRDGEAAAGPSVAEAARRWPPQQAPAQPSSGSSDGAFDPALCDLARSMPLTDGAAAPAAPQQPLATQHASDASVENSGAMSGSMPYGGTNGAASLGNTADFSPTLPPLTSPFTFDFMLRQRSARAAGSNGGYATPSAFDAEPTAAEAAEAAAALAGPEVSAAPTGGFNVDADFPPLEAGMSASFRTRTDAPPLTPHLASPFDAQPTSNLEVSLDGNTGAGGGSNAECKTAPFFRASDAPPPPDPGTTGAYVPSAPGVAAAAAGVYSPAASGRNTTETASPTSISDDAPAHLSVHSNQQSLSMSSTIAHCTGEARSPTKAPPPPTLPQLQSQHRTDLPLPEPVGQRRSDAAGAAIINSQQTGSGTSIPRLSASFGASFGGSSFDAEPPIASLNTFAVQQYNTPFSRPPSQTERSRNMHSSGSGGRRSGHPARIPSAASRTVSNASRLNVAEMLDSESALAPVLESSFDAEPTSASAGPAAAPPSARDAFVRTVSSASFAGHAFAGDAMLPNLVSGFDAEPPAARAGSAAVAPALISSFDAEPNAAVAGTLALPSFAAGAPHLPNLTSLFDFEPSAAGPPASRPIAPALASMFDMEPSGAVGGPPAHVQTIPTPAAPFRPPSRTSSRSSLERMRSSSRHASHDHSSTLSRVISNARSRLGAQASTSARAATPTTPSPLHSEQLWQPPPSASPLPSPPTSRHPSALNPPPRPHTPPRSARTPAASTAPPPSPQSST